MPKPSGAFEDVLVLSPEAPYPPVGGGPSRTASLIEYFRRTRRVHVITFREPDAPDPLAALPGDVQGSVIELPRHSQTRVARGVRNLWRALRNTPPLMDRFSGFEEEVAHLASHCRFSLGVIEHFWCANYAPSLRLHCERLLLDLHNVESVFFDTCAEAERGLARAVFRRFARSSRELEARWLPEFSQVLVTSDSDARRIERKAIVYPNAIPLVNAPKVAKVADLVFSGNLEYRPNRHALDFFRRHIWPRIRAERPEATCLVVGRNHHSAETEFGGEGIRFTGPVKDAIAAIASARVAIVPIISGSGTRVKILEAWAAQVPVVSTALGAEGLPARNRTHLQIANDADAFAAAVLELMKDPSMRKSIGEAGRDLYEREFAWPAAWRHLEHFGL